MTPELSQAMIVIARILVSAPFVIGGIRHFFALGPVSDAMTQRGVPQAKIILIAGSVYEAVLGIALALGIFVTPAALGLIVFTVLASFMMLNFWDKQGPEREALLNGFLANVAIVGGLAVLAATA